MYHQSDLIDMLKSEEKRYQTLLGQLEAAQKELPGGSLVFKNGSYYRAVTYDGKRDQIIISEKIPDYEKLIYEMKEKRYIAEALPILKNNLFCCRNALDGLKNYDPKQLSQRMPHYYSDFQDERLYLADDTDPELWANEEYEKNPYYPQNLIHSSEGGLMTRSKSEAAIATKLEQSGLSFRYEPALHLGNKKCFPDFCILHPVNRRKIYWEHFGKMDDEKYVLDNMKKLWDYSQNGYLLGHNLIMTWEAKIKPLTYREINDRIQHYFFLQ